MKSPEPIRKRSRQSRNNFLITALSRNLLTKGSSPSFGDEIRSGVQPSPNSFPRARDRIAMHKRFVFVISRAQREILCLSYRRRKISRLGFEMTIYDAVSPASK